MHLEPVHSVSADGVMLLAGHDVRDLVARFGSPLVVMLEDVIRFNCRAYRQAVPAPLRSRVYYAAKAFLCTGLCKLLEEEGLGLDVVSAGELHTALSAGFPPDRILLHGNAKTEADLRLALESGVGRIALDNLDEIDRLEHLAAAHGVQPRVYLRVTPGIKPTTHRYIQTGQIDSKFGFNLVAENGRASEDTPARLAARRVLASPHLSLIGLHCHIGSQIEDSLPFAIAARAMLGFYAELRALGAPLEELDLGGGLGVRYLPEDYPPSIGDHLRALGQVVIERARELGLPLPILCDEPGRSIVGRAGVSLYTVQSTKRIQGVRSYASVDGGMCDNPRFALYEARHQVLLPARLHEPSTGLWTISGRCCESGDLLAQDVHLPEVRQGDLLALMTTGAYTYSMASNYNRVPRPAVVLAAPGRAALLVERESPADLCRLDRVPGWLSGGSEGACAPEW